MGVAETFLSDPFTAALSEAGERYRRLNARIENLEAQRDEAYEEFQRLKKAAADFIEGGFKNVDEMFPDGELMDLVAGKIKRTSATPPGTVEVEESKRIELALAAAGIDDWKVTRVSRDKEMDCITLTREHGLARPNFNRAEVRQRLSNSTEQFFAAWRRGQSPQECADAAMSLWGIEEATVRRIESRWDEENFKYVAYYNGVETDELAAFEKQIGEPVKIDEPTPGYELGFWKEISQSSAGHDPPRLN